MTLEMRQLPHISVEARNPETGVGWHVRGPGWTMEPVGNVSREEAKRICAIVAMALMGGTDDQPDDLFVRFNRELVKHFAPSHNFSMNEILVACGTIVTAYLGGVPDEARKEMLDKFIAFLTEAASGSPKVAIPIAGGQSEADVRSLARRQIRIDMMRIDWMSGKDKEELTDLLTTVSPEFEAYVHRRRIEGGDPAILRNAGVVLLATMLNSLVANTTADKAARKSVARRLYKNIWQHLEGQV